MMIWLWGLGFLVWVFVGLLALLWIPDEYEKNGSISFDAGFFLVMSPYLSMMGPFLWILVYFTFRRK